MNFASFCFTKVIRKLEETTLCISTTGSDWLDMAHKHTFDIFFPFCLPTKKSQTFMMGGVVCHRDRKRINCM